MQKNLIVARRGYGKTYKSLQYLKNAGCTRVAVCVGVYQQINWIQSKISEDIYPDMPFVATRFDMTIKNCCHYDFFTSLDKDRIRGKKPFDGLLLYSIDSWCQQQGEEAIRWTDIYNNALSVLTDDGLIIVTSEERKSPMLETLILSDEYFLDTPGTRVDREILFPTILNQRDMSIPELRSLCTLQQVNWH